MVLLEKTVGIRLNISALQILSRHSTGAKLFNHLQLKINAHSADCRVNREVCRFEN